MIVFLVLNNLALTYQEGRKYKEAIKTYEESLELIMRCDDGDLVGISTSTYMERCSYFCFLIVHVGILERWKL